MSKTKYLSDVTVDKQFKVKKPFKILSEENRRFIRIEISEPVDMMNIKDSYECIIEEDRVYDISGSILNISAGGVLVDIDSVLEENDLVLLKFSLQDTITLNNVLGLVKRVDHDEDGTLTGIEFLSTENLKDIIPAVNYEMVEGQVGSFEDKIQQKLSEYLY